MRYKAQSIPWRWRTVLAVAFLVLLLLAWAVGKVPLLVVLVYVVMSGIALGFYGFDKSAAKNNRWRTPESTLHFVSLLGGWPGALVAQEAWRHKVSKPAFQAVFRATVAFNVVALAVLIAADEPAAIGRAILDFVENE